MQVAFPHPATDEQRGCVELLGAINADITGRALQLMAAGDAAALGALMSEAQRAFTARAAPLCPSQLTSPVLHRVLAHPPIQPHIYGGKGVGSQVGGRRCCHRRRYCCVLCAVLCLALRSALPAGQASGPSF